MTRPGHAHQYTTNGDRYQCPVQGCWWTATGAQVPEPGPIDCAWDEDFPWIGDAS